MPNDLKKLKQWDPTQMRININAVRRKEMGYLKTSKGFDVPKSILEGYVISSNALSP